MTLCGAVMAEYEREEEKPMEVMIDAIGTGAGCADRLIELGLPARAINVSEAPSMGSGYLNLRAELWYKAREWLESRTVKIPHDSRLIDELTTPRYQYTSSGKVKIESKEDLKRRKVKSPDSADAFVLTFAGVASSAMGGLGSRGRTPLKRGLSLV